MQDLDDEARRAKRSPTFGWLIAGGLVAYGGVHLVIAWLFVQVAWTSAADSDNRPIMAMSRTAIGQVALWAAAVGMAMIVIWRVLQVISGQGDKEGAARFLAATIRLFEATIYVLIAISAVQAALTRGRQGSIQGEGQEEQSLGTAMMQHAWSRIALGVIAIALLALGVQLLRSALTRSFTQDLAEDAPRTAVAIGAIGTFFKGIAVAVVALLIGWAVITYDPSKTAGIEAMIETLREAWYGQVLLTGIAAGLACYGVYCFTWSVHAKH
jgi:hypothetical protein